MYQGGLSASSPCTLVPLEEGGRHALLRCSVYLPGNFCWGDNGGGICNIDLVWEEGGIIVTTEGVGLGPCKVVLIGVHRWHEAWAACVIGHGEGWCRARKNPSYLLPSTGSEIRR